MKTIHELNSVRFEDREEEGNGKSAKFLGGVAG